MQQQIKDVFKRYRQCKYFGSNSDTEKEFTKLIEHIVDQLPEPERDIIKMRYMNKDADYITDKEVYLKLLKDPLSSVTYIKYKKKAISRLLSIINKHEI